MDPASHTPLSILLSQGRTPNDWDTAQRILGVDLVHESTLIRSGLVAMLGTMPQIRVSRDVQNVADYQAFSGPSRARVAFVSPLAASVLTSPRRPTPGVRREGPDGLILVAASFSEFDAREAFQRGIRGLMLLSAEPADLLEAARRVAGGGRYVMQSIASDVAMHACQDPLTSRERQILALVADGECNQTIAESLGIAISTVKAHVQAVMSKLDVRTRTQAALVARHRGITGSWVL